MTFDLGKQLLEDQEKIIPIKRPGPDPLKFPGWVLSGVAGKFAELYSSYLESPKEFFYFSFLTCLGSALGDRLTLESEIAPQPRLYTILLGESADDRKSTAASKTVDFFLNALQDFNICYGIGSAEGLQNRFEESSGNNLLIFFDEFKAFVSKSKIEGSILLPCVNTLFESNRYENQTKKSRIFLEQAHLSLLGASTTQTYENMWSSQFTDIGFNNRLWLVPGSGKRKHSLPQAVPESEKSVIKKNIGEVLSVVKNNTVLSILPEAYEHFQSWYMNREVSVHTKRLDTYAQRLMPLLAVNEGETEVDLAIVKKVIALADWQLEIRKLYDPIDADNAIAKMETKIKRQLNRSPMSSRDLKRNCHADRTGLWVFKTALENLRQADEISWQKATQTWRIL